jgi:hypothetical protein
MEKTMNIEQYTNHESPPITTFEGRRAARNGFTLMELVIAVAASMTILLISGVLLESGQKSWAKAFNYANSKSQLDALTTTITFGQLGRQSNKLDYKLYDIIGSRFVNVPLPVSSEEIVKGKAVEFHYWNTELKSDFLDTSITGNSYALFYLDDDKLMLQIGPYPSSPVDIHGNLLAGPGVTSGTVAENVVSLEFSHTTLSLDGKGRGCVRLEMKLRDPVDKSINTVTAATLMRNVWP